MSEAVHEIVVNLDDQVRLYRRLCELSRAQLDALQRQDVHSVHAILQEIEMTMLDRAKVEARRATAIERLAIELGIEPTEVTAQLVQQHTDATLAGAIDRSSTELRELIRELDGIVARNKVLLQQELDVIDGLVKGMTAAPQPSPAYGKTGVRQQPSRLKLLDAQV